MKRISFSKIQASVLVFLTSNASPGLRCKLFRCTAKAFLKGDWIYGPITGTSLKKKKRFVFLIIQYII